MGLENTPEEIPQNLPPEGNDDPAITRAPKDETGEDRPLPIDGIEVIEHSLLKEGEEEGIIVREYLTPEKPAEPPTTDPKHGK